MTYKYWLPDERGNKKEYTTAQNAVMIIGANGAGKSKLGAWIERQSWGDVHRVGAQRNLNFNENIPLKSYSEAENWVFYGSGDGKDSNKGQRWGYGHYTTKLMDDFNNVLSALIARRNNEINLFHQSCKEAGRDKIKWPDTPITSIDRLKEIWTSVLPQRKLVEEDSKLYAILCKDGQEVRYSATEMSDGERAVLYLAAQVLCVPENKIMIIDEPEVHLHRSIMNRLWKTLESYRPDCLFIYITHDLQFASAHGKVDKIWIKEFDGEHWEFEKLTDGDLPEELSLEILGSRRNVIFVEGEKNSYDYQLYTQLYPNYLIIPCGGCSTVIQKTKAFRNSEALHGYKVFGLIDRDYRSQYEIESYKKDNIYTLGVAEVENLFLVEELIRCIAVHMGKNPEEVYRDIQNYVVNQRFKGEMQRQICESVVSEIKYRLTCIDISKDSEEKAQNSLNNGLAQIDFGIIKKEKELLFNDVEGQGYSAVLKCFNRKNISLSVGHYFGLKDEKYRETVIGLLYNGTCKEEIKKAIRKYLPAEIPLEEQEV